MNEIFCGINYEVLKNKISDESIDLTITSPPYDDAREYEGYSFDWNDFLKIRDELYRVTKQGGVVVWIVGDMIDHTRSESGTSCNQSKSFRKKGFLLHDTMIFEKSAFANPSSTRYHQIFEYMFVFSKNTPPKTFNPIKDRKNEWYKKATVGKQRRKKDGSFTHDGDTERIEISKYGMRRNIWRYKTNKGIIAKEDYVQSKEGGHPAIFPEALARDHIYSWSNEGDVVLDPFCGSGTTLKMAYLMNRKYIGIDISEKYCELSRKRLRDNQGNEKPKIYWDNLLNPKEYSKNENIVDFL